jgi:hypothetical protein
MRFLKNYSYVRATYAPVNKHKPHFSPIAAKNGDRYVRETSTHSRYTLPLLFTHCSKNDVTEHQFCIYPCVGT